MSFSISTSVIFSLMRLTNSMKSMVPLPSMSISMMMVLSSSSLGFWPIALSTWRSSTVEIVPLPSWGKCQSAIQHVWGISSGSPCQTHQKLLSTRPAQVHRMPSLSDCFSELTEGKCPDCQGQPHKFNTIWMINHQCLKDQDPFFILSRYDEIFILAAWFLQIVGTLFIFFRSILLISYYSAYLLLYLEKRWQFWCFDF